MVFLSPLARRFAMMGCIMLALLFAGMQGASLMDRIQHGAPSTVPHEHMMLSLVEFDHGDGSAWESAQKEGEPGGQGHVHHHHAADHGASLPAFATGHADAPTRASIRLLFPHYQAMAPAVIAPLDRPPKPATAA